MKFVLEISKNDTIHKEIFEVLDPQILKKELRAEKPDSLMLVFERVDKQTQMLKRVGFDQSPIAFEPDQRVPVLRCALEIEEIGLIFVELDQFMAMLICKGFGTYIAIGREWVLQTF